MAALLGGQVFGDVPQRYEPVQFNPEGAMKAIVLKEYGDSNKLALQEIAEPKPGPGEIKVKVPAAGPQPHRLEAPQRRHEGVHADRIPIGAGQ